MNSRLLFISMCLIVSSCAMDGKFIYCGNQRDNKHVKAIQLALSPLQPIKGLDMTIGVNLDVLQTIISGKVEASLKFEDVIIFSETLDLCDLATRVNITCPVKKGPLKFSATENLPQYAPSGKFTGKASFFNQDGAELLCFELLVHLN